MAKQKPWQSDEEFELLLRQSLTAIQPPADFSSRVMAAVAQEKLQSEKLQTEKQRQTAAPQVVPFPKAGRRPARRFGPSFWPGLGTVAASLVLFWAVFGLSGGADEPVAKPFVPGLQTAEVVRQQEAAGPQRPDIIPGQQDPGQNAVVTQPEPTEPTPQTQSEPTPNVVQPAQSELPPAVAPAVVDSASLEQPNGEAVDEVGNEAGNGELILPRAAYGTDAQGTLSVRLLAEVPSSEIYSPAINSRGTAASFYTADAENVYSWRVSLAEANSPEVTLVTSRSDMEPAELSSLLSPATAKCQPTELVASPDGTIMAQNSLDGIWISLAEGEVYNISDEEKGGSLLAWSPDASKLLFTNAEGQLFMSYPLEKRIYQITDLRVKDVCWSADNQTIIFLATDQGQDALYIAELI